MCVLIWYSALAFVTVTVCILSCDLKSRSRGFTVLKNTAGVTLARDAST